MRGTIEAGDTAATNKEEACALSRVHVANYIECAH